MRRQRRTTVIVAGGALAIASVGYGLGTQADDGTAVAESSQQRNGGPRALFFERGAPPGFSDLADTLGVDSDQLQMALRDFHEQEHGDRRDEFATDLAKALGISAGKVTTAFEALHQKHEDRLATRLAKALGADVADVKAALEKIKDDRPVEFGAFAGKLADELGLDEADVRDALTEARPERGGPHRRHAMPLRQLASALDVTRAELRKALNELRPDGPGRDFREHQQELASFLADRFNLDVDRVSEALADLPRPAPPHGGRPGPGGPGAFGP